jgi:hypothetical protein
MIEVVSVSGKDIAYLTDFISSLRSIQLSAVFLIPRDSQPKREADHLVYSSAQAMNA